MQLLVDADPVSVLSLIGKVGIKGGGRLTPVKGSFSSELQGTGENEKRCITRGMIRRTFVAAAGSLTLTTNMDVLSKYSRMLSCI